MDTPPFDLPSIRRRIRRLEDLAGKFSAEALHVYQKRVPLKVDEIKAYGAAMHLAAMAVVRLGRP